MTMQHKITWDDRVDIRRVIPALVRRERIASMEQANLRAASKKMSERKPKLVHWYCLQVKNGRELAVENALHDADVEAFMPREKVVKIHKGRKMESHVPFFPGYLLVRCVPSPEAFVGLKQQKHVVDIVGGDSGYHIVKNEDVNLFRQADAIANIPRISTDKTISEGDRAEIHTGPFSGFSCLILGVRWCREARARVLIDVAGRSFEIKSMPLAFVKKL